MGQGFDVDVSQHEGVVLVSPAGRLEDGAASALREILGELAEDGAAVVLDLGSVTAIDGNGVQLVLETHARSRRDGLGLTLLPGPPPVMRMFELAGVLPELPFEPGHGRAA